MNVDSVTVAFDLDVPTEKQIQTPELAYACFSYSVVFKVIRALWRERITSEVLLYVMVLRHGSLLILIPVKDFRTSIGELSKNINQCGAEIPKWLTK